MIRILYGFRCIIHELRTTFKVIFKLWQFLSEVSDMNTSMLKLNYEESREHHESLIEFSQ